MITEMSGVEGGQKEMVEKGYYVVGGVGFHQDEGPMKVNTVSIDAKTLLAEKPNAKLCLCKVNGKRHAAIKATNFRIGDFLTVGNYGKGSYADYGSAKFLRAQRLLAKSTALSVAAAKSEVAAKIAETPPLNIGDLMCRRCGDVLPSRKKSRASHNFVCSGRTRKPID